jgi:Cu/Ag efflux pump CusA
MRATPGLVDIQVEKQVLIPQRVTHIDRERAAARGIAPGAITEQLEQMMSGATVGQVIDGQRSFDVVLLLDEATRADPAALARLPIRDALGGPVPLGAVADTVEGWGPNQISREAGQRRIIISANVAGTDLASAVEALQANVAAVEGIERFGVRWEGQFASERAARRQIALLSLVSLALICLILYAHFGQAMLVSQILLNIPLALVGAVAAIWLTDQTMSVATLIGFVTVCGIASRNTIMMLSHYLHLMAHEGEVWGLELVVRGSLERLVPVLMTALTSGLALIPLLLARGEPGKELLAPIAAVVFGGLISATLLDLLVTPAAFWAFGHASAHRWLAAERARTNQESGTT